MKFADENKVNMTLPSDLRTGQSQQAEARMASQPSGRVINEVKDQQMGKMNRQDDSGHGSLRHPG